MLRTPVPTRIYGIIGHPLGHSLSPVVHNWAFQRAGLPNVYMAWAIEPEKLGDFMITTRTLPVWGVSVTIPHKEAVIPLVDEVTDRARTIGAVNTLYWRDHKLVGGNTDALGFLAPIRRRTFASALVLGAGGASRAVLAGLLELGVRDVFLSNRSPQRARDLAEEFGVRAVDWDERTACDAELLVNTTPLGMAGENKSATPWPAQAFSKGQTAYDLVYNPMRTRFLCEAEAAGCATVDGLSMFIGQAQAQFGLWTGNEFSLDEGRSFLIATLGAAG